MFAWRKPGMAKLEPALEPYRNCLTALSRLQIYRRLQGKVGASDLV
jgi:hypothetical protein